MSGDKEKNVHEIYGGPIRKAKRSSLSRNKRQTFETIDAVNNLARNGQVDSVAIVYMQIVGDKRVVKVSYSSHNKFECAGMVAFLEDEVLNASAT